MMIVPFAYGEVEYKVSRLRYQWWDKASFPVTLHTIGYTHTQKHLDLSVKYGNSTRERNELNTSYRDIDNQIKHLFSFGAGGRYRINRFSFVAGGLYTEYKEVINGKSYPDTGFGYYYGLQYEIDETASIKLSFDHYYSKDKEGHGREVTEGTGISIVMLK
jgi:long-subunit fatty acid transport protein